MSVQTPHLARCLRRPSSQKRRPESNQHATQFSMPRCPTAGLRVAVAPDGPRPTLRPASTQLIPELCCLNAETRQPRRNCCCWPAGCDRVLSANTAPILCKLPAAEIVSGCTITSDMDFSLRASLTRQRASAAVLLWGAHYSYFDQAETWPGTSRLSRRNLRHDLIRLMDHPAGVGAYWPNCESVFFSATAALRASARSSRVNSLNRSSWSSLNSSVSLANTASRSSSSRRALR
jgi:hypothetical protein